MSRERAKEAVEAAKQLVFSVIIGGLSCSDKKPEPRVATRLKNISAAAASIQRNVLAAVFKLREGRPVAAILDDILDAVNFIRREAVNLREEAEER